MKVNLPVDHPTNTQGLNREQRWNSSLHPESALFKSKENLVPSPNRGSGSRGKKYENLERIDRMVNDSYSKLSLSKDGHAIDSSAQIDVGLWKNMIFYKSIAHVHQESKKPKTAYANIPSKIGHYLRKPVSKSRSKSKDPPA
jgi:hypothetical protein